MRRMAAPCCARAAISSTTQTTCCGAGGEGKWFYGRRIQNSNTHGTGCTLSSAIAANLAKGYDLDASVERAKAYLSGALGAMLDLGHGSGPMDHMFDLKSTYIQGGLA